MQGHGDRSKMGWLAMDRQEDKARICTLDKQVERMDGGMEGRQDDKNEELQRRRSDG